MQPATTGAGILPIAKKKVNSIDTKTVTASEYEKKSTIVVNSRNNGWSQILLQYGWPSRNS